MTLVSCVSTTERCARGSLRRLEDGAMTFLYIISFGTTRSIPWDFARQYTRIDGAGECSRCVHLVCTRPTPSLLNTRISTPPGTVIAAHDESDEILNKRVFLVPTRGREKDPLAPWPRRLCLTRPNKLLSRFGLLWGGNNPPTDTFSTYCIVSRDQVILTPAHIDNVHAAAWPVTGVTARRYVRSLIISLCTMYSIFVY